MKISNNSRLIRFAYGKYPPDSTTLCALFWRTVGLSLLYVTPVIALIGYILLWIFERDAAIAISISIAAVATAIFLMIWAEKRRLDSLMNPKEPSVARKLASETFYAVKNRVCPIIYITQD